jgi:hypothetical protein
MEAAAHNPQFASKAGIPQGVAQEYVAADAGTEAVKQTIMKRRLARPGYAKPTGPSR